MHKGFLSNVNACLCFGTLEAIYFHSNFKGNNLHKEIMLMDYLMVVKTKVEHTYHNILLKAKSYLKTLNAVI